MARFSVTIRDEKYQKLINDTLGDKELARNFVANISTVVAQNQALQNCDAATILSAGLVAESLKLPLSPTLGFAYVIPYGKQAQFQVGYKGLIQLAQRTGLYERIGVRPVHEGEYAGQDEFGDDLFKFSHEFDDKPVIGYYAYFKLLNGFRKSMYWTVAQCEAHGKRFSKTGKLWKDKENGGFEAMASKTVLKLLINRYGPMSVDLQKAIQADQAVIKGDGTYDYVDNGEQESNSKTTIDASIIPQANDDGVIEADEITPEQYLSEDDKPF